MICDKCNKNPATYFSTVNINGVVTSTHLCGECANANTTFNFNSFFGDNKINNFNDNCNALKCNNCGYLLTDYVDTGLLGCAKCYKYFKEYLNQNLINFQYDTVHVGKNPINNNINTNTESKLNLLKLQLKQAVSVEDYELASELKKQILDLEEGNNGNK